MLEPQAVWCWQKHSSKGTHGKGSWRLGQVGRDESIEVARHISAHMTAIESILSLKPNESTSGTSKTRIELTYDAS